MFADKVGSQLLLCMRGLEKPRTSFQDFPDRYTISRSSAGVEMELRELRSRRRGRSTPQIDAWKGRGNRCCVEKCDEFNHVGCDRPQRAADYMDCALAKGAAATSSHPLLGKIAIVGIGHRLSVDPSK